MFNKISLLESEWHIVFVGVMSWDVALDMVLQQVAQEPDKKKIAFQCRGDGLITEFDKLANIVNEIEKQTDIRRENIVLIIGSMCEQHTFDTYNECVIKRDWPPLTLVIQNSWEGSSSHNIRYYGHDTLFDSSPKHKNKLLLFFNGEARPDRGFMLASLIEHHLMDRSYVSAYHTVDIYSTLWLTDNGDAHAVSGLTPDLVNILTENAHMFPMELTRANYNTSKSNSYHPVDDAHFFNDSYFSLVHETIYYDTSFWGSGHIPTMFLTEKTFKVIAAKHPFIIAQRPNILQALRNDGYRTFHPYIDESYDTIEDDVERLHAIKNEVLRLSKYSDDEWLEFQRNVKSIIDHNFYLLSTKGQKLYRVDGRLGNIN